MNVLVTGGAGYIGSVVVEELCRLDHDVVVLDNLSKGYRDAVHERAIFVEGGIGDETLVKNVLNEHGVEAVIHMAAFSLVAESVQYPDKYRENNVIAGRKLLGAMAECDVRKIVFSSTAAVYGEPEKQPVEEQDRLQPTNPYGETKLEFERELEHSEAANGLKYVSLRYFNAAGATERCGERHYPETHLIPIVLNAALGRIAAVDIFGDDYPTRDGTCVRDYIHVLDLARAHVMALDILETKSEIFNLGCGGGGYTVREVIETTREVTGLDIPVRNSPRRPGDPAVLVASSEKIRAELGWTPEFQSLEAIVSSAWNWMRKHPEGGGAKSNSNSTSS